MKKNIDKILVLLTIFVVALLSTIVLSIDLVGKKNIQLNNTLAFGRQDADLKIVVFEDFQCKYCKKYSQEFFPRIKAKYIDTGIISYELVPLAFIYGSRPVANAAIAIYELYNDKFFEFIDKISDESVKIDSKEEVLDIIKTMQGIDLKVFEDFLKMDIFEDYLENNFDYAHKIMPSFKVPSAYINGEIVKVDELEKSIDEIISYREMNK